MSSLFDRYLQESDAFGSKSKPELSRAFKCLKGLLVALNILFLVSLPPRFSYLPPFESSLNPLLLFFPLLSVFFLPTQIFGCILMGIGSVAYNRPVGSLSGTTLPIGIVVLGVFIMFLSFLGCVSAWRESRIFLGLYFFFLSILTFLLLVVGLAVYVKRSEAGYYMSQGWEAAYNPVDNGVVQALQLTFSCCGLYRYNDTWAGSSFLLLSFSFSVPVLFIDSNDEIQPPIVMILDDYTCSSMSDSTLLFASFSFVLFHCTSTLISRFSASFSFSCSSPLPCPFF
jgi:hypothetical protein